MPTVLDTLINLFAPTDRLKRDIAEIRSLTLNLTREQQAAQRKLEDQEDRISRQRRDNSKEQQKARDAEAKQIASIAQLQATFAKKNAADQKAIESGKTKGDVTLSKQITKQKEVLSVEKQKLAVLQKEVKVYDDRDEALGRALDIEKDIAKVETRRAQDSLFRLRQQSNAARSQILSSGIARSRAVGAGIQLATSGIPGTQTLGSIALGFSAGGPIGGGIAAASAAITGLVSGFGKLVSLGGDLVKTTYEYSTALQQSKLSVAGIVAQTAILVDMQGNIIPEAEKFNVALQIAGQLQTSLIQKVLKTNITLAEANEAIQTGLGILVSRGVDPAAAQDLIITLTSLAKNLGFTGARAAQEVRGAVTGTRNLLTSLLQSAGISMNQLGKLTGKELEALLRVGTNQLAKAIDASAAMLSVQLENIGDTFKDIFAGGFTEAEAAIAQRINELLNLLTQNEQYTELAKQVRAAAKEFFDALKDLTLAFATTDNLSVLLNNLTAVLTIASQAVTVFRTLLQVVEAIASVQLSGIGNLLPNVGRTFEFAKAGVPSIQSRGAAGGLGQGSPYGVTDVLFGTERDKKAFDIFAWARDQGLSEHDAATAATSYVTAYIEAYNKAFKASGTKPGDYFALDDKEKARVFDYGIAVATTFINGVNKEADRVKNAGSGARIIYKKILTLSDEEARGDPADLQKSLARVKEMLAVLARQKISATPEEDKLTATLRKAIVDKDALKEAQARKALSDYQTKIGIGTKIVVPGAASDEEAEIKLRQIEEMLQNKIDALQHKADERAAREVEIKQNNERIEQLQKERADKAELMKLEAARRQGADAEAVAIQTRNKQQLEAADAAVEKAQLAVDNQIEQNKQFHLTDDQRAKELELTKLQITLEEKLTDQQNVQSSQMDQISPKLDDQLQKLQQIQATTEQTAADQEARSLAGLGLTGAVNDSIALGKEVAKVNSQFVRQGNAIEDVEKALRGLLVTAELLRARGVVGADKTVDAANAALDALKEQQRILGNINDEYKDGLNQRYKSIQLRLEGEELDQQSEDVNTKLAAIEAEKSAGLIDDVRAWREILDLNKQLLDIEIQKRGLIFGQIDLVKEQQAELEKDIANQPGGVATDEQAAKLRGLILRQKQLNGEIAKTNLEIVKLEAGFISASKAIIAGSNALAQFFSAIKLTTLAEFIGGIGLLTSGISKIQSKGGLGGWIKDLKDIFGKTKGATGGGIIGTIAGVFQSVAAALPVIGSIVQGGLQVFSAIRSLFTSSAKKMAADIEKTVKQISDDYSAGLTKLTDTIADLERQRQRTFALENKKGGKDLALKQRAELDSQLRDLKKQQADILDAFNLDVGLSRLGLGFTDLSNTIRDAGKRIQEYLGAGGSIDTAQEYLTGVLKSFKENLQSSIVDEQTAALERAQSLIDLQRQLDEANVQHQRAIYGILTEGIVQRELTFGQKKAQQIAQENAQYEKQRKELEDQITTTSKLLDIDKQILDNTVNLNDAEAIRLALLNQQLIARQKQVDLIKDQLAIVNGIVTTATGTLIDPELYNRLQEAGVFKGTGIAVGSVTIQVNIDGQGAVTGAANPDLQNAVLEALRQILISSPELEGRASQILQP